MSKRDELKRLAELTKGQGDWYEEGCDLYSYYNKIDADFIVAANPDAIMALIAENEALRKDAERYRWIRNDAEAHELEYIAYRLPEECDEFVDAAMEEAKDNG